MVARLNFQKFKVTTSKPTVLDDKKTAHFHASIPFLNRKDPLKVTIEAPRSHYLEVMDVFDTLAHESVQRRFLKENKTIAASVESLQELMISNGVSDPQGVELDLPNNTVKLAFLKAKYMRGDALAWVMSGGTDKGFAYPWIFKLGEDMGLSPDFLYFTSTAVYFGGVYAFFRKAQILIDKIKEIISSKNWHRFVDLDVKGALTDLSRYKGAVKGEYLMNMLKKEFGMKDVYMSDLKIPTFAVAVRLPSKEHDLRANAVIFCDPKNKEMAGEGPEDVAKYDYKLYNVARASGSLPVGMEYFNVNREGAKTGDGKVLTSLEMPDENYIDGGTYENIPNVAMRRNKNVGYVWGIHLGDSGENALGINNAIEAGMFAIDFMGRGQQASLEKRTGVIQRYFNPRFFKLGSLAGLPLGQLLGLSAVRGIKRALRAWFGTEVLSISKLRKDPSITEEEIQEKIQAFRGKLFSPMTQDEERRVKNYSKVKRKVDEDLDECLYLEELNPQIDKPLDDPEWKAELDADGGYVKPCPVERTPFQWLWDQACEQINPIRAAIVGGVIVAGRFIIKSIFWNWKKKGGR